VLSGYLKSAVVSRDVKFVFFLKFELIVKIWIKF